MSESDLNRSESQAQSDWLSGLPGGPPVAQARAQFCLDPARQYDFVSGTWTPPVECVGGGDDPDDGDASFNFGANVAQGDLFHRHRQRSFEFVQECLTKCRHEMRVWKCRDCNKQYVSEYKCKLRICAPCARARAMKYAHRYQRVPFSWPVHITMGLPLDRDLSDAVSRIIEAVRLWRQYYNDAFVRQRRLIRGLTRAGVCGSDIRAFIGRVLTRLEYGIWSVEINRKRAQDAWYVHAHQLVECRWVNKDLAEECWRMATQGAAWVVKLRRVGPQHSHGRFSSVRGAVYEVCKYVSSGLLKSKNGGNALNNHELEVLYRATFDRKLIGHWGMDPSWLDTHETSSGFFCQCGGRLRFTGESVSFQAAFRGRLEGIYSLLLIHDTS